MAEIFNPETTSNLGQSISSITQAVDNNFAALIPLLNDTLSRSGQVPNTLSQSLDVNSNRILNIPSPVSPTDVVRLSDLSAAIYAVTPVNGVPGAVKSLQIGSGTFGTSFSNGMDFGVSNTTDTSWTAFNPILGLVASGAGENSFVGYTYNNLPPSTFALPTGTTGYGKLSANSFGNAVFGLYGLAEIYSTGGGAAIAAELTCRNFSGNSPDTNLPPNEGIGTPTTVSNALQVTCGGTQNSSIGISISPEGGSTKYFGTGIYMYASSWSKYGIYVETPVAGATAAGVFMGYTGILNNAPFSPLTVTPLVGDSFELRQHHLLSSGPTLVGTDTGKSGGSLAPMELWGSTILLNGNVGVSQVSPSVPLDVNGLVLARGGNIGYLQNMGGASWATINSTYLIGGRQATTGAYAFSWNQSNTNGEVALYVNGGSSSGGFAIYNFPNTTGSIATLFGVSSLGAIYIPAYTTAGILVNDSSGNITTVSAIATATTPANFSANRRLPVNIAGTTYYIPLDTATW